MKKEINAFHTTGKPPHCLVVFVLLLLSVKARLYCNRFVLENLPVSLRHRKAFYWNLLITSMEVGWLCCWLHLCLLINKHTSMDRTVKPTGYYHEMFPLRMTKPKAFGTQKLSHQISYAQISIFFRLILLLAENVWCWQKIEWSLLRGRKRGTSWRALRDEIGAVMCVLNLSTAISRF